ncbi:copper resistance protein CopC [Roseomonas sp. NAR14]|uniref:Copper resistance protein CopC n=1 Tax=Roseomonas acroporae TaxID=2937791 RepID=A0A9X1YCZ6_9PROT|nr:copper resistance CopC family protein [Roseomonas acroporae]MCK8786437.1 copper resistance protein CopC [Roseomonas acroporae]
MSVPPTRPERRNPAMRAAWRSLWRSLWLSPGRLSLAAAALLAVAPPLLAARPAAAHAIVVESRPAAGTAVPAGPVEVDIRYNSRIDVARSRLGLARGTGQAGEARGPEERLALTEDPSGARLIARTGPLEPGPYRLRWQVLAVDGHITRGDIVFTVVPRDALRDAAPGGTPQAAAPATGGGTIR